MRKEDRIGEKEEEDKRWASQGKKGFQARTMEGERGINDGR